MTPRYKHSVEVHRGSYGADGRMVFSGDPEDTVSGSVFRRRLKAVVSDGETINVTAQGLLELDADVQVADHLLLVAPATVSGQRYEVLQVIDGEDHRGNVTHKGVELRDATEN